MPRISIIMAAYNTPENYLHEAIDSVINQTYQDWELLVIDDCSTKVDIKAIVENYHCDKIKYFKNPKNIGASGARNVGLENAKGEFIAILDSDDIACPKRFEKQVHYLESHPDVGAVGSWAEVFPEKQIWMPPEHFSFLNVVKFAPWLINSSMMIRRDILKKYELTYDTSYIPSEDYHLWSRLIRYTKIANIQEVLVHYRAGQGISFTSKDEMFIQTKRIQSEMISFLTEDEFLKEQLEDMLFGAKNANHKLKHRIKYNLYKGLWLLGGKRTFFKEKMNKEKRKLKGF